MAKRVSSIQFYMGFKNYIYLFLIFIGSISYSESVKTVFNPFTGKSDYITKLDSTTLPSGSTQYIQNTLTPTTTTQAFSVQQGQITGVASSTTSFQVNDGNGTPVIWIDTTVQLSTNSAFSVIGSTSMGYDFTASTTIGSGYQLKVSTTGAVTLVGSGVPVDSFALCLIGGVIGHCTTVVGAGGGCTCVTP